VRLFVYGTLTDPETADAVVRDASFAGRAVCHGLHRVEGRYPTLAPGGRTEGRLLETEQVAAVDACEGVGVGLYVRVALPFEDGATVQAYVGDPDRLGASAEWPGEGPFPERVRRFVASGVRVSRA
jgi:gamma-glutamylcyclotransferase (GGCT)/AIG2-like uncharacterized protein YtfP